MKFSFVFMKAINMRESIVGYFDRSLQSRWIERGIYLLVGCALLKGAYNYGRNNGYNERMDEEFQMTPPAIIEMQYPEEVEPAPVRERPKRENRNKKNDNSYSAGVPV